MDKNIQKKAKTLRALIGQWVIMPSVDLEKKVEQVIAEFLEGERNTLLEEAAKVADEQTNTHTKQYLAYSGPAEFSPFAVYSQACGDIANSIRALKS